MYKLHPAKTADLCAIKMKTSTRNHLDTYTLSVRVAPHVLWDPTCLTHDLGVTSQNR